MDTAKGRACCPELESHLVRCADCAADADSYRKTIRLVAAAYEDLDNDATELPDELVRRILNARRGVTAELVTFLSGLVASPILTFGL